MKKTIKDYEYFGKKVILRCDLNVPIKDGKITDDSRILGSLESINYLINKSAKIIIMSHLGKIKTEEDKKNNSLMPVYEKMKKIYGDNIYFSEETTGKKLEEKVQNLKNGQILLLENTRYEDLNGKKESNCDVELSKYWASLADIFINDAYGTCHRNHASNVGISKRLPNGIGFLVEKEVTALTNIMEENTRPFVVIMGGKKIEDKIPVIENLVKKCDKILVGGGMCFTFLKANGIGVGSSIIDAKNVDFCKKIIDEYGQKIVLPVDFITNNREIKEINEFSENESGYDIGPKTIEIFEDLLKNAKRVIVNGPMGIFEENDFANGTKQIYTFLTDNKIKTLIGGGDSAASVNKLGFSNKFYHVSTGGGATLEYLAGKIMPGIDAIEEK